MFKSRKVQIILGILIISCGVLWGGIRYGEHQLKSVLGTEAKKIRFSLMELEGKVFDSRKLDADQSLLLTIMPDQIGPAGVAGVQQVELARQGLAAHRVKSVVASRWDQDHLRNLKRLSQFAGPIVLDPGGSILTKFFPASTVKSQWFYLLLDPKGNVLNGFVGEALAAEKILKRFR